MEDSSRRDRSIPATPDSGAAVRFPFPPLLFGAPLAAALGARRVLPLPLPAPLRGSGLTQAAGAALVAGGVAFSLLGAATVLGHRTTVIPHHPVSRLVTSGPFRISRNPMYTGQAVACVGAALWAGTWWPVLVLPLSVVTTVRWVIEPEESYLARRFGADYERYRSGVRRWF